MAATPRREFPSGLDAKDFGLFDGAKIPSPAPAGVECNLAVGSRMFIVGLGTAAPAQKYAQRECWEALQNERRFAQLNSRSRAILKKVLTGSNGIATRHLALPSLKTAFDLTPDALHERFLTNAPALATHAAHQALEHAHLNPAAIDALLISTCTGYLCPGLTSYVGERLGVRPEILSLDLVGQGCGAAIPNLRTAEALLKSGQAEHVLSICVEVCSAAFYLDDDPGVLISACLFGDGAGAAILANAPNKNRQVEWALSASGFSPEHRESLRFEHRQGMLRNVLRPEVPGLAARQSKRVLQNVLDRARLRVDEIRGWMFHPGGRDVLLALREQLDLDERDLRWSAGVLNEFGNLSSASLFFVLRAALSDSAPGGHWLASSFGAGFSGHGALLQVE